MMDNPFKKISHEEQLPEFLKKKVLSNIDLVKLGLSISDLFVVKIPSVILDLLPTKDSDSDNKYNKKTEK